MMEDLKVPFSVAPGITLHSDSVQTSTGSSLIAPSGNWDYRISTSHQHFQLIYSIHSAQKTGQIESTNES